MHIEYSSKRTNKKRLRQLEEYRHLIRSRIERSDFSEPESALATWNDALMREGVAGVKRSIGDVKTVVLIGIGGSSLGTEAVHDVLGGEKELLVLDTISPEKLQHAREVLSDMDMHDFVICVVSKSGTTTETVANAYTLLHVLEQSFGLDIYQRVVCVSNPETALLKDLASRGAIPLPMHEAVGGRYSVCTAAGLVPLTLLGHDVDSLLHGLRDATHAQEEENASRMANNLMYYLLHGVKTVNFFVFDRRLEKLGYWYRQLAAESLGKEYQRSKRKNVRAFIPTVSTPADLHAIGQLYFSGFSGVYTYLVRFAEPYTDFSKVPEAPMLPYLTHKSEWDIEEALFAGVHETYKKRKLDHAVITLSGPHAYEVGLFLGTSMLQVMYLAVLLNVNAFDQPNVEFYKQKMRDILQA